MRPIADLLIEGTVFKNTPRGNGDELCPYTSVASPSVTLVRNKNHNILVDTGVFVPGVRFDIVKELKKRGIAPLDIDTIIYTHLHEDHCQNTVLFENARILVGARELDWFRSAIPPLFQEAFLPSKRAVHRVIEDEEIDRDVIVICTPGHTEGHISVVVQDGEGPVVIAGDAVGWRQHYEKRQVSPIVSSGEDFLTSLDKIRDFKPRLIIPGHEPPFVPVR